MATVTTAARPAAVPRSRRKAASPARTAGIYLVRILLACVFIGPLLFMFVSSFKPDVQIFRDLGSPKAFLPVGHISLDNYRGVFHTVPAERFLINSIGISAVTVVLGLIVNSLAAFALARMRWPGKKMVLAAIIATLIVPFETLALPLVWWVNKLPWLTLHGFSIGFQQGWLDTYRVQILPFVANAFSIYLFYQYFDSIPKELDEAALVDGAGWFTIYRRIILPLAGPAIATVAILTFLPAWNSYLWPLMVVQTENLRPVMVGIDYFHQLNTSYAQIMAYASMITVPVLVLFVAFQRAFIGSIAASGVKG